MQQPMNRKEHWNHVYQTEAHDDVSWYQSRPATSLKLIEACGVGKQEDIIDVGGGASVLVDFLLDAGFTRLAVLDISAVALAYAKERLGARVGEVEWFEADVTGFTSPHCFNLWHDRAVSHFLTDKPDRQKYVQTLKRTLTSDGYVIIATFAIDGPLKCSGLEVARYDASMHQPLPLNSARDFACWSKWTRRTRRPGARNKSSAISALPEMPPQPHEA
jgi:ubiquinone/menaquinone biosynthesis C-methylase UbiE